MDFSNLRQTNETIESYSQNIWSMDKDFNPGLQNTNRSNCLLDKDVLLCVPCIRIKIICIMACRPIAK
jgi:hypothetical protein